MTFSAFGQIAALMLFFGGVAYFARKEDRRIQRLGIAVSIIAAVVIGWFSWLLGTSA